MVGGPFVSVAAVGPVVVVPVVAHFCYRAEDLFLVGRLPPADRYVAVEPKLAEIRLQRREVLASLTV